MTALKPKGSADQETSGVLKEFEGAFLTRGKEEFKNFEQLELRATGTSDKGPRSRVVEAILLLLYTRPMRSSEIAGLLRKKNKVISSYLSYWKVRGYVEFRSGYWVLTKKGEEHVATLLHALNAHVLTPYSVVQLAQKLVLESVPWTENHWKTPEARQGETEIQSFTVRHTGSNMGKQVPSPIAEQAQVERILKCLERIVNSKDLSEEEAYVLRHMVKHYTEWGSTYLYLDQLSEDLHYQPQELLLILRKLQTKKLLYLYTDKRFGIRVGLGKSLKQLLDTCAVK